MLNVVNDLQQNSRRRKPTTSFHRRDRGIQARHTRRRRPPDFADAHSIGLGNITHNVLILLMFYVCSYKILYNGVAGSR